MASCLVVQHVAPERPYAIGDALGAAGVSVDRRCVFTDDVLPSDLADMDGLVVMGGPMSADSDDGFPTRSAEIDLLAEALERGLPTLGVCLGAQLLAVAGGGAVGRGPVGPEVGWAPVHLTGAAADDPLLSGLPGSLTVLHWHSDTFDLPPEAILLASNDRYRNQAFRCGFRAWGLQFHVEVDERAVAAFLDAFGADAGPAGTTPATIAGDSATAVAALAPDRDRVLARFATVVVAHERARLADLA